MGQFTEIFLAVFMMAEIKSAFSQVREKASLQKGKAPFSGALRVL